MQNFVVIGRTVAKLSVFIGERPPSWIHCMHGNAEIAGLDIEGLDIDGRMCAQATELKLQNVRITETDALRVVHCY